MKGKGETMSTTREPHCNIFLREDIRNALNAAAATNAGALRFTEDPRGRAYQEGFRDALLAIALAFGIQASYSETSQRLVILG